MIVMSQYKSQGSRDVLAGERERTLAMGVRKLATSVYSGTIQRAFQEVGCSCNPYRGQIKELEQQYNAERQRMQAEYQRALASLESTELAREIRELKDKVREIDHAEHPILDAQGSQAYHFLPVWLMDRVRQGDGDVLGLTQELVAQLYAEEWMGGWRPRSLKKARRTPS